jgi:NADH-quinone oxidoreductase subunit L
VLMWIATIAIAGIPPFSGFFSKDEILTGVFARAQSSTLAESNWLGIPGSALLYAIYFLGIVTALITAVYMTRMMLYAFHGPNRTGERERDQLHEPPLVMTIPLVVLAVLSATGGWINLPGIFTDLVPTGPRQALHHWLEPVVGSAELQITHGSAAHLPANTEYALIGAAVGVAVLGIVLAAILLRPARLRAPAEAPPEQGIERVLAHKYYVDEAYDRALVQPTVRGSRNVLWRGVDTGLIDGLFVNGSAYLMRGFGWLGSQLQTGSVGTYVWVFAIGVVALIGVMSCS